MAATAAAADELDSVNRRSSAAPDIGGGALVTPLSNGVGDPDSSDSGRDLVDDDLLGGISLDCSARP